MNDVLLFNPLPSTLAHYALELEQTLARLGIGSSCEAPRPATDSAAPRAARAASHLRAAARARRDLRTTLVLWPAFGWLEPTLWGAGGGALIVHDPTPLRRQYGGGRVAREWARRWASRRPPELICHTEEAAERTAAILGLERAPAVCLHPILSVRVSPVAADTAAGPPVVLVAGQHKPSRDLDLLAALGPRLRESGYRPRIIGRGWPELPGWDRNEGFLGEEEFAAELAAATVALVPYRHYWQSGIAVRALESGVAPVGRAAPFLRGLLGEDYPGIVAAGDDLDAWSAAIERAVDQSTDLQSRRQTYQDAVDRSWSSLIPDPGASN